MLSVSVFGLGYVGSVTAACLAHVGAKVTGVDIDSHKVELLSAGRSPIVEKRMDELADGGHRNGNLRATTDVGLAVRESEISFICVATPSQRNGKLDLSSIERVSVEIGQELRHKKAFHTVVVRSTVLPGTAESLVIPTLEKASGKCHGVHFAVCMNPEFMREGTAVDDFFHPPFTILGRSEAAHAEPLRQLYSFISAPLFEASLREAEMVKYVCNSFHALKVSFANEIGTFCQRLGVDPSKVIEIFTADTKLNISPAYLSPGFAFGGSCLPKDVRALNYRAKELDLDLPLLRSVLPSNSEHIERAAQAVLQTDKRRVGLLGLSFKAGTDDLRESPSVQLVKRLLGEGLEIKIWDDKVALGRLVGSNRRFIEETIPHIGSLLCEDMVQVIESADVILLGTKAVSPESIAHQLRPEQVVIDLVRMKVPQPVAVATKATGVKH